jgi:hypothetical protein
MTQRQSKDQWPDEPLDDQLEDIVGHHMVRSGMRRVKPGCERLPGASGALGTSPTNPVPVNGTTGVLAYLNRLRNPRGSGFLYHRLGKGRTPVCDSPVEVYELVATDASQWLRLHFAPLHERRSILAPKGLGLVSWHELDGQWQILAKLPVQGVTEKAPDFPLDLPGIMERLPELNKVKPGLGHILADHVRSHLIRHPARAWSRPGNRPGD